MIARVFPRKTSCTPMDDYAFIGEPPLFLPDDLTKVHVSVTFSWDIPMAERLVHSWKRIAPTAIGGPATGQRGEEFTSGLYLKKGCVITSRGCPNNCWFCEVPKREGVLRELPIAEGNNVLDDNLLACSDTHIKNVFRMLEKQSDVKLTGGLEAKRLKPWHLTLFERVKVQKAFFAYDTPDDWEPLVEAVKIMKKSEWYRPRKASCYVLMGYTGDTLQKANERCTKVLKLGLYPFAMFYKDKKGEQHKTPDWQRLQRTWTRPAAIYTTAKNFNIIGG